MGGPLYSHFAIQMHYNNPTHARGVYDSSGFEIFYKKDVAFFNANGEIDYPNLPIFSQLLTLGTDPASLMIPPGQEWFAVDIE